jgi:hypothetical protein
MGVLQRLGKLFSAAASPSGDDPQALWLYVQCDHCGEKIRVRVDKANDLQQEFGERDAVAGYTLRKDIIGQKCFRMLTAEVHFDRNRQVLSQSIEGGRFITRQEYEAG